MMYCPNCGLANRDGSRFCNECGQRLFVYVACVSCGFPNPASARFCNQCGLHPQSGEAAVASVASPPTAHADAAGPPALAGLPLEDEPPLEFDVPRLSDLLGESLCVDDEVERTTDEAALVGPEDNTILVPEAAPAEQIAEAKAEVVTAVDAEETARGDFEPEEPDVPDLPPLEPDAIPVEIEPPLPPGTEHPSPPGPGEPVAFPSSLESAEAQDEDHHTPAFLPDEEDDISVSAALAGIPDLQDQVALAEVQPVGEPIAAMAAFDSWTADDGLAEDEPALVAPPEIERPAAITSETEADWDVGMLVPTVAEARPKEAWEEALPDWLIEARSAALPESAAVASNAPRSTATMPRPPERRLDPIAPGVAMARSGLPALEALAAAAPATPDASPEAGALFAAVAASLQPLRASAPAQRKKQRRLGAGRSVLVIVVLLALLGALVLWAAQAGYLDLGVLSAPEN